MQQCCNKPQIEIVAAILSDGKVFMESKEWADRFGSVASSLCAVHCAICAFLPVAFSALGLGFLLGQDMEWLFSIVAILFGLGALVLGWRQHRSKQVGALLVLGIVGIMASRALEMGSDHHGHGGDAHHEASTHDGSAEGADAHEEEQHHEERSDSHAGHEEGHDEHEDPAHLVGAVVGVLAGLFLLMGHIFNIRAARRCREESCA